MVARARTVTGDGLELAVWEQGEAGGPTVVLVHGYPDTHVVWDGVAADLAADHHVVTYDVRGAGRSEAPPSREGYDLRHLVADLAAVIDAVSPGVPVHLVGHDWGSIQGWEAVTDRDVGGRISSYTSISGPPLDHVARWMRARRRLEARSLRQLVRQGVRSWYVAMFQVPGVADAGWGSFVPRSFRRYLHRVEGVPAGSGPASSLSSDGRNGLELYRRNVPQRMRTPQDRHTEVPVLLLVPTGDRFVTPGLLEGLDRVAPNLVREDIDGRHWVVVSQAPVVAARIRDHVALHPRGLS